MRESCSSEGFCPERQTDSGKILSQLLRWIVLVEKLRKKKGRFDERAEAKFIVSGILAVKFSSAKLIANFDCDYVTTHSDDRRRDTRLCGGIYLSADL